MAALWVMAWTGVAHPVAAQEYETQVVAVGLHRPTGIALDENSTIFFTEVPTPGVSGAEGGTNSISKLDLNRNRITVLSMGEPEPVNIAIGRDNSLYWTCKSAGVILKQDKRGRTTLFLSGLTQPNGIAVARDGLVYFTQLPTPGVSGANGGSNTVNVSDGNSVEDLTVGEPEPTDIVVARNGDAYWTCRSAGVILERSGEDGAVSLLLGGLEQPTGIALSRNGRNLYFTEVPTPGVSGRDGGRNKVWELDLLSGVRTLVNEGDPEPADIAVAVNGNLFWTCTSAGVIVMASPARGRQP
jgi:sugar lactone lactonase YvrE